jgi:uncharacterized protein (DUF2141 family)
MKKYIIAILLFHILLGYCYSQTANNVNVTIEITNVTINNGKVYLAIFSTAESFRREEPFLAYVLESNSTVVSQEVSLPAGEYVVSGFQDTNNNQKLDYKLFGIPREPVAISNYNGQGFPSRDFNRQKITINGSTQRISIGLYRF